MTASAPLLAAERALVGARATSKGLSFSSEGDSLLVLGAPFAFRQAVIGVVSLTSGFLKVRGKAPRQALSDGDLACAVSDPLAPPHWTVRTFIMWSVRLSGRSKRAARAATADALAALKLEALADQRLVTVPVAARRAASIAAALATGAATVVMDDPTQGLPLDVARAFSRIATSALAHVSWILLADRVQLSSPFSLLADDAIVLDKLCLAAQGSPAHIASLDRIYDLQVLGDAESLRVLLVARGISATAREGHLRIELGESDTTRDVFALALEAQSPIVSLRTVGSVVA